MWEGQDGIWDWENQEGFFANDKHTRELKMSFRGIWLPPE
jgi:hypothetical protein